MTGFRSHLTADACDRNSQKSVAGLRSQTKTPIAHPRSTRPKSIFSTDNSIASIDCGDGCLRVGGMAAWRAIGEWFKAKD